MKRILNETSPSPKHAAYSMISHVHVMQNRPHQRKTACHSIFTNHFLSQANFRVYAQSSNLGTKTATGTKRKLKPTEFVGTTNVCILGSSRQQSGKQAGSHLKNGAPKRRTQSDNVVMAAVIF